MLSLSTLRCLSCITVRSTLPPSSLRPSLKTLYVSVMKWNTYLPGVCVEDLRAEVFPAFPVNSRFKEWGGAVHVELKQGRLTPVCKQIENLGQGVVEAKAALARKQTECELLVADAVEATYAKMQLEASKAKKDEQRRIKQLEETFELFTSRQKMDKEEQDGRIQFLETKSTALRNDMSELRNGMLELKSFMKKGLQLGDKVKKRVALTLARIEVEKTVGRMKDGDASWSEFFAGFTLHEWDRVHVVKQLVRELLADGAHEFNDSIHKIPPDEVVGSIVAMPQGSLRSAWEEIFFLAFWFHVTDQIFQEEVEFAQREHRVLE